MGKKRQKTMQRKKIKSYSYKALLAQASNKAGYKAQLARERLDALHAVREHLKKCGIPYDENANNLERLDKLLAEAGLDALHAVKAKLRMLGVPFDENAHSLESLEMILERARKKSAAAAALDKAVRPDKLTQRREVILIKKSKPDTPASTDIVTEQTPTSSTEMMAEELIGRPEDIAGKHTESFSSSAEDHTIIADCTSQSALPLSDTLFIEIPTTKIDNRQSDLTDDELVRRAALSNGTELRKVTTTAFNRNNYVSELAKRRAKGICQLCGNSAPFKDELGIPYLESHHIEWLSKGGEDSIENTVALCPNCHRKMHILGLESDVKKLYDVVKLCIPT